MAKHLASRAKELNPTDLWSAFMVLAYTMVAGGLTSGLIYFQENLTVFGLEKYGEFLIPAVTSVVAAATNLVWRFFKDYVK